MKKYPNILLVIAVFIISYAVAQPVKSITIKANYPGITIKPTMWGIFFEDINLAADGGIYAELVKNRSFEFTNPLMGCKALNEGAKGASILVINREAVNKNNPRYIRVKNAVTGNYGIANEGFRGMGIEKHKQYNFSVWARWPLRSAVKLRIELVNEKGETIGTAHLNNSNNAEWTRYTISITATATDAKAQLNIWFEGKGSVDLDMISLFPQDTWKKRPGGLRADLVQLLADMKPGFIRFPGGCIVEGRDLANRYQWIQNLQNNLSVLE